MAQGIFNCEVLLRLLRDQGYTGGITLIRDCVKPHRPPRKIPAVQPFAATATVSRTKQKPESIRHQAHRWVNFIPALVGQMNSGVDNYT